MRVFKLYFVLLFICSTLNADINKDFHFGISVYDYDKAQQQKIKSVVLKVINEFREVFKEDIHITFLENEEQMIKDYVDYKNLNTLIIYSSGYLENKDILKKYSKRPFVFNHKDKYNQYYLIANKDSKIEELKDLKNKVFSNYTGNRNLLLWFDYLIRKNFNKAYDDFIKKEYKLQKDSKALLDVYFKKVDFTVVDKNVYEDMVLLNPALKKNLKIVEKSDPIFIFGLGFFHKNTPDELVDVFFKLLIDGTIEDKLKDLLGLLNQRGFRKSSFQELKVLEDFCDEYEVLKKSKK